MITKKKVIKVESVPKFETSVKLIPEDSKIFVEKSLEIATYISQLLEEKNLKQKDLAARMGKSEAEMSKWLSGMHNFTLRSLSKLEAALGTNLITISRNVRHSVPVTRTNNRKKVL